jgi:hypothetical protein
MFDWKRIITESGVVISIAETARDAIVEGINKELERQLEDTRDKLTSTEMELANVRYELRSAMDEVRRLKEQK